MKTATLAILAMGAVALAACDRRLDSPHLSSNSTQGVPLSSGKLIGTPPAPPTTPADAPPETTPLATGKQLNSEPKLTETPQTTSSAAASQELTKSEEHASGPLPGQPNDHSNLASDASQRAGQSDPQMKPDRTDLAPAGAQRDIQTATQK
jgi:hypothetical protein